MHAEICQKKPIKFRDVDVNTWITSNISSGVNHLSEEMTVNSSKTSIKNHTIISFWCRSDSHKKSQQTQLKVLEQSYNRFVIELPWEEQTLQHPDDSECMWKAGANDDANKTPDKECQVKILPAEQLWLLVLDSAESQWLPADRKTLFYLHILL